ncbi:MAG TPA: oligoendopeptidase F [Chloroflexota bacterium]|nr:oligoendopeptidase F [Chloroflexota bacterium]
MARDVVSRTEVDPATTWDVESVFPNDEAWEQGITEVNKRLNEVSRFRGRLKEGPEVTAEALQAMEALLDITGKVFVYASMQHEVDTTDQSASAKYDRMTGLLSQAFAATAFIEPELLDIGSETLSTWIAEDPRLEVYRHFFDQLEQRRPHVRSAEVEQVLGWVMSPFFTAQSTHGVLADADLTFAPASSSGGEEIAVNQGNIDALLTDSDREVRRTAWESYADAHLAFKNTMASCLSAGIKQDVFNARVRGYSSSLEASLQPNHVPTEVFYQLIETFKRHLPTWHRYWRLRRESLGYDRFHVYDVKAPMIVNPPEVSLDESITWIVEGMKPLGEEYVQVLENGVRRQRWVDVYPNIGKRAGAFSSGWRGTHPFILMSFTDDIFSMSTLAHELGHSLHSYYTWASQPQIYSRYSMFVAEVASNFNQAMVRDYLFETKADKDFQLALIDEAMSNFHRYFFIMPTLARFELEIHERTERDEPLTAQIMNELMADLFREGYGDEVVMDADRVGITWAQFPTHLYANFYVFQYATGISAAHALCKRIKQGGPDAAQDYLSFLAAGDSMYPLDALKLAGVDMTTPQPVEEAFSYLGQMVDRLEQLLPRQAAVS